jgi:hypothetical protein
MGRYQMCRLGPDIGDYAPDNVKIATHEENVRERSRARHLAGIKRRGQGGSWLANIRAANARKRLPISPFSGNAMVEQPWLADGVSMSTWYRRRAEQRAEREASP